MMMSRALSIAFGVVLLAGSLYGLCHSLFLAEDVPIGVLAGASFYVLAAGYWLWADLLAPPY